MASFCEKCKKTEFADGVVLKRCGQCKNVFYCSGVCQKADWTDHKYFCRKPEAVLRKEAEKGGFMGMKNAVNVPVDVDPVTGEFDARGLMERIQADQQKIGKTKVSAPPPAKQWMYKLPETEEERKKNMDAFESALDMAQFSQEEKQGWLLLSVGEKDFIWALWQLFSEGEARLPLVRSNTRCVRELIKWVGGRYAWVSGDAESWQGVPQSDKSKDAEIQKLIEHVVETHMKASCDRGFDCTMLTRFFSLQRLLAHRLFK